MLNFAVDFSDSLQKIRYLVLCKCFSSPCSWILHSAKYRQYMQALVLVLNTYIAEYLVSRIKQILQNVNLDQFFNNVTKTVWTLLFLLISKVSFCSDPVNSNRYARKIEKVCFVFRIEIQGNGKHQENVCSPSFLNVS